jgi:hypothetical protein
VTEPTWTTTRSQLIDALASIEVRGVQLPGHTKASVVADDMADAILAQLPQAALPADPLTVRCGYCCVPPGGQCCAEPSLRARKPHAERVRLARAVAAHADPALDAFPELGPVSPCGLCGTPGLPQRHRMVDAIAGRLEAGEGEQEVAADYLFGPEVAEAVKAWMTRWPGAWG